MRNTSITSCTLQPGAKPREGQMGCNKKACLAIEISNHRSTHLVTAIPAVTHEVEGELLLASLLRRSELQLGGLLLLQRNTLDDKTGVVGRPPH